MTDGPLLIIAGPGTGKTRTLTHRIAHLITRRGVAPEHVLAVTFTNRAANEMCERLQKLVPTFAPTLLITTFHGLGYRILREHWTRLGLSPTTPRVATESECRALLGGKLKFSERKAGQWLKRISALKRQAQPSPQPTEQEGFTLATYDRALRERGWLDFDDLIGLTVQLLESNAEVLAACRERFRHVSVDEFQDIDTRQYRLIQLLVPAGGNVCVIGDPDQAIYGFRGAEPRFFQQFVADHPGATTVQLRRNYRSGQAIVQGALQAIAPATLVEGRVLEALQADATRITIHESASDKAEAEFVVQTIEQLIGGSGFFSLDSRRVESSDGGGSFSFSDFAVLYRTAAQAGVLSEALARSGIPFQCHANEPLTERPELKALLPALRRFAADVQVVERLRAACHDPLVLALEPLAMRCGCDCDRFESELALLSEADLWDPRADRVSLLTLHASKGLEFPVVFVAGCEDGLLPLRFGPDDTANVDEERRLFFVGMTRARERLFLSHAKQRLWRGQVRRQSPSEFIAAIQQELLARSKADWKPRARPAAGQLNLFA